MARTFLQICFFSVMLAGFESIAQTVRVTALDLTAKEFSNQPLHETAQQLKPLAPDVILLRGVTGWKMAAQFTEALQPAQFHVAACSAFGSNTKSGTNANQAAILARKPPYFSWSEPWKLEVPPSGNGGLTFAAIEIAGHRFGFLSLNLPESDRAIGAATQQWLETLIAYRQWSNNRLEGFVAATFHSTSTDGELGRMLRAAGFSEPYGPLSAEKIAEGHLPPDADSPKGLLLPESLIACDFDFHPAPVVVIVTNSAPLAASQNPAARTGAVILNQAAWWIGGALTLIFFAICTLLLGIRRKLNRLQAQNALAPVSSYNLVMASPAGATTTALVEDALNVTQPLSLAPISQQQETISQHGLFAHFAQWLKQAFVQRLLNDRQKLLDDQQVAARKVTSVDERLARLETKIQQQTAAYEKEIELLNQKLLTAREENLELIRSQIKFLKSEMEATRTRVLEAEET